MPIDPEALTERLERLAPFESSAHARRALEATLQALRDTLEQDEEQWLARDLGDATAALLAGERRALEPTPAALYERVAEYAGVRHSLAQEQARVACRALAEGLPHPTRQRLQKHLPALAELFELPEPEEEPAGSPRPMHLAPGPDRTLAGGRPGGTRPLYDAAPLEPAPASDPSHAHRHSVARSADPHGDTKLSSAHGLTQEREARSLATARTPPSKT